ncbi:pyridoxal phosphate-dependent transferase [Dichotomocladium elegans]|nr:pyridoxal phosphate-dependent transferase [Dichotomocladium elegans]
MTFGRHLRSEFMLDPKYIPLNHGSFGVFPRTCLMLQRELQDKAELNPDRWTRFEAATLLQKNRERLANFVHCKDPADIVFAQNASAAASTVLRSFPFVKGDKILCFNTTYVNVSSCLDYLEDSGLVTLVRIPLTFPMSNEGLLDLVSEAIANHGPFRFAVVDAIVALPGVVLPFQDMTRLLQKSGTLVMVDAAHALGQIPINLGAFDPDFLLSNTHKWLYTPRGCTMLYVAPRNQKYIHPLVINQEYKHSDHPQFSFQKEFANPGVVDMTPYMCIERALEFRESLGGEEAITQYCHNLAMEGGALVAKIFQTSVLENGDEVMTANMVNVEAPLTESKYSYSETISLFTEKIIYDENCMVPLFFHNNKWYVRLSAQVYTDIQDFKEGAEAIARVCKQLQK